ncbi:hypothetical protein BDR07DRAFT_1381412 [Suillus spraguei]|nr:hypothetical protein BDR07DRAFT_1381412 [Suillus spraguei]
MLLFVMKRHSPAYDKVLKRIFPDCLETNEGAGRSSYCGFLIDKAGSVDEVYQQYHDEWTLVEGAAAKLRSERENEVWQLRIEGQAEEQAQWQAEVEQARRQKEEAMRQKEKELGRCKQQWTRCKLSMSAMECDTSVAIVLFSSSSTFSS